jgi:hypothetical protein
MSIDWIEVDRTARQVELDYGRNGYLYAERLAAEVKAAARSEESEFWASVAAPLRPRGETSKSSSNPDALRRAV